MTARWSISDLSIVDADGSYVTTISEPVTPAKIVLNAGEAITAATADLFRIKQDYELKSASDEPWEAIATGDEALEGDLAGTAATFSITGHVRHETYILVVTFDSTSGEPFTRTRILECAA